MMSGKGLMPLGIRDLSLENYALTREAASKFEGKEVEWKSPAGKIIKGKIAAAHGGHGVVRAIFERGLPGQAVSEKVEIK